MGDKIYNWIKEQVESGKTVYASTHLRSIKISKKTIELVRVKGLHCEVLQGKQGWVSINFCKITAV
jgi:hypothetical protein